MSEIAIRPLTTSDAAAVREMELRCFTDPWSADAIESTLADESVSSVGAFAADGTLIGFGMVYVAADEADIANIAVDPDRRRAGIGRAMLRTLVSLAAARGAAGAYLEVRRSNAPAIALYTSAGFETLGVRKNYYHSPKEDALIMGADITGQI